MTLCDIKIDYINSVQGDRDEYKNVNKDAFLPNRKYKCKIHKLVCIINCSQMRQKKYNGGSNAFVVPFINYTASCL